MDHIAIDLGSSESQICVRNSDGQVVEERRCATSGLRAYLSRRPKSRVVLETGAEGFAIADAAMAAGHEVRVVPCSLVRSLGVGARRMKTDRRDAQILSEVSCRIDLPSVHIPSKLSRERKTLCGMREALVGSRTKLINTVRGWLRTQNRRLGGGGSSTTFPARVRRLYKEKSGAELPSYACRQLAAIEELTEQIREADAELIKAAGEDETCQRLMTVPGVGARTAIRFVAALDEIGRFPGAHGVESYLGLVPGEHSSAEHQRRTGITKAGPSALRWTLVQASWIAMRHAPKDSMVVWAHQLEQRRGRKIAVVALARKLAGILYAIWRDGTVYQPAVLQEGQMP
jgi:transposase